MLAYKPGWATTKLGQTYQQTRTNFLHIELYLWIEAGAYLLATSSLTRASRLPDGATAEWGVDLLPCRGTEAIASEHLPTRESVTELLVRRGDILRSQGDIMGQEVEDQIPHQLHDRHAPGR